MKIITLAAVIGLTASQAFAGGLAPVVVEPVVITEAPAPTSSLGNYIVPLIFLGLVAAAAAAESDSDTATSTTDTDG